MTTQMSDLDQVPEPISKYLSRLPSGPLRHVRKKITTKKNQIKKAQSTKIEKRKKRF